MKRFRLSPEAAEDITEIWEFIAQDNLDAAERVRRDIYDAIKGLVEIPQKGHTREDLTEAPVLFWTFGPTSSSTARKPIHWRLLVFFTERGMAGASSSCRTGMGNTTCIGNPPTVAVLPSASRKETKIIGL